MAKSVRPLSWLKQVALGLGALGTVIFTAQHVRPVYAGRAPVVRELLEPRAWGDSALARAPWASRDLFPDRSAAASVTCARA